MRIPPLAHSLFVTVAACAPLTVPSRGDVVINEIRAAASDRLLQWDGSGVPQVGTGTRWIDRAFSDAAWRTGPGPFGFGTLTNNPVAYATRLETSMRYFTPTLYLRSSFTVSAPDAARTDALQLVVDYNDGFVAYLNGVEIARRNAGPARKFIYHDQPAYNRETFSNTVPIPTTTRSETIIVPQIAPLLVEGANVLAIHALNGSATDATFYFKADLMLTGTPTVNLVNAADPWKYFVGVVEPSGNVFDPALLGSGKLTIPWGTVAFDDIAWSAGAGPIGAGSPGVTLGTNLTAQVINTSTSVYTRKVFTATASEAAETQPLQLIVRYDDGFVAYINGVEVARRNIGLPNTFTPHQAVADSENNTTVTATIDSPSKLLVPGNNVLAVQVHNFALNNNDLLIQADLKTTGPSNTFLVTNATTWKYLVGIDEPLPAVAEEEEESPEGPESAVDWIELHNNGAEPVAVLNWSITDNANNPRKWIFPDVTIPADGYLLLICDGANLTTNLNGYLHTNFQLDSDGEYIGLFDGTGALVEQLSPGYPRQLPFHSHVRVGQGTWRYSDAPSPGAVNGGALFDGIVAAPTVGVPGRFYTGTVNVPLSCATPGAVIRYTLDGSDPTETSLVASGSLSLGASKVLRARAFLPGSVPSSIVTHTYLIGQSAARQSLPAVCLTGDEQRTFYRPFGVMAIVGGGYWSNGTGAGATFNGLWHYFTGNTAVPTTNPPVANTPADPLAYHAPMQSGQPAERPAVFEILHSDATPDLRTEAGVRAAASPYSRPRYVLSAQNSATPNAASPWSSSATQKPQLNLFFRDELGGRPLNYPLVPGSTVSSYENIRLRAGKNDISNPFIRDEYVRRLFLDMGHVGVRGDFVNLYINSVFKGYFNITERPREPFFQQARGTDNGFDVRNITVMTDGDTLAYNELLNFARTHTITTLADYEGMRARLDVVNFADYILLNVVAAMADWPGNNFVMDRERSAQGLYRFTVWDAEGGFGGFSRVPQYKSFTDLLTGSPTTDTVPARLFYTRLKGNPEFRLLFADRIQKHLFNGGMLADAQLQTRYNELKNKILPMIRDVFGAGASFSEFLPTWLNGIGTNTRYTLSGGTTGSVVNCPGRRRALFDGYIDDSQAGINVPGYFVSEGLWPATRAPDFSQLGGNIAANFQLTITNPNASGTIYYTTNGTDPRAVGGTPVGATYNEPVTITQSTQVKARVYSSGEWSPLTEVLFVVSQTLPLLITEVMYHPPDIGSVGGDEFEFVEIKNVGTSVLNLNGITVKGGVEFGFPSGAALAPGAFSVIVKNPVQFAVKYPGVPIAGVYEGSLNNSGEQIVLRDLGGAPIFTIDYLDAPPWPTSPDALGYSLVPINPDANPNPSDASNWRASTRLGGSPGANDLLSRSVFINELTANPASGQNDAVELYNAGADPVDISNWWLSDSTSNPKQFRIPAATIIPSGGYVVFDDVNPTPGQGSSFEFSRLGEEVVLSSGDAAGNLTGYVHRFSFGASAPGVSFGRLVDSTNAEHFVAQSAVTLGAANIGALVGPIVITEIMYHAAPGESDFIELRNISDAPIPLFDPANPSNTWRVRGISLSFPAGVTLQPRQIVLLSSLPVATFRARYNVPDAVQIFEFSGSLDDDGELVVLQKPAEPMAGQALAYIDVDGVNYSDGSGWPVTPDGAGPSLERVNWRGFADDRANWRASSANGGTAGALPATDFPAWQSIHFTPAQIPNIGASGADADGDGLSNFLEYAHGLDPLARDASSAAVAITLENDGANGPYLTIRYRRNRSAIGVEFHVDTAADLPTWMMDAALPIGVPINNGDGTDTVTMRDNVASPDADRRFIRLRVIGN